MNEPPPASPQSTTLRERAEKAFREMLDSSLDQLDSLSPETLRASLYELRVHQIELEMQNEDLRRAQADLDASRARYFDLYDLAPVGYCTVSEKGLILEANLTAATLLRRERDALVGRGLSSFISKEDQELYYLCRKNLLDTLQPQECDLRMVRPDGTAFFAHLEITAACDENGAPVCRFALIDVTGRKQDEKALTALAMRNKTLMQSSGDGIHILDDQGNVVEANETFCKMLGYTGEEALHLNVADWDTQWSREELLGKVRELIAHPAVFETRHRRKDGAAIDVEISGIGVSLDGHDHLYASARDITGRKKSEEALRNLRAAVEQSANTVAITDIRGNIEYVNPAFEKATGYTAAEAVGKTHRMLKSGEQDAEFYRRLWTTIMSGKIWQGEFHNRRKDGSLYWETATISPVQNDKGETVRYLAIKEDITEQKQAQDEILKINRQLEEATARAEKATAAKSEFLATMTHELRNPLTGVLGFAELLSDTTLDDEQHSLTEGIRESGIHLLDLINDVLDFSSIEKGALAIHSAPFDLAPLVKLSSEIIRKSAADKGVAFHCELAAGVPAQIIGDERRIRQILINLLANAVKFTSDGSVSLRVTRSGQSGTELLDFSVEDTGLGISSEALDRLFQPFMQADSSISQKYGGTGIGLAVSQRLAEAMGGSISVVSAPGKGSTFTFRLPLEPAAVPAGGMVAVPSVGKKGPVEKSGGRCSVSADFSDPKNGTARSPSLQGTTGTTGRDALPVLVVEDDRSNSFVLGKMLQSLGYRVEFAGNGTEAVEAFAPGKHLAILMDLRMPGMNGFEAAGIIRSRESGSRVPIIALSANVTSGSREIYLAAGMDDFLAKPFKKDELAAKLACIAL